MRRRQAPFSPADRASFLVASEGVGIYIEPEDRVDVVDASAHCNTLDQKFPRGEGQASRGRIRAVATTFLDERARWRGPRWTREGSAGQQRGRSSARSRSRSASSAILARPAWPARPSPTAAQRSERKEMAHSACAPITIEFQAFLRNALLMERMQSVSMPTSAGGLTSSVRVR